MPNAFFYFAVVIDRRVIHILLTSMNVLKCNIAHGPLQIGHTTLNQGSTFAFPPLLITLVENQNKHNIPGKGHWTWLC